MSARILISGGGTGGHLYPALNLAAALRRAEPECRILLVGAERGIESQVLPGAGYPYRLLPAEPLRRSRPWRNWRLLAAAPRLLAGVSEAFRALDPDLVVGTGGYASWPALAYGIAGRRPTAIQEQNAYPGLVTRLLAPHVNQIHLGYPEAASHLKPGRATVVRSHGNPVSSAVPETPFPWPAGRLLLVTGGSQGARGLNQMLMRDLSSAERWPEGTAMVWIAGPANVEAVATAVRSTPWADRIRVVPYVEALGRNLGPVSLAIARAGAMSTSELAAAGVPAVLVPLPTSAEDHQRRNASALAAAGAALVFEQDATQPGELWGAVERLMSSPADLQRMAAAMRDRGKSDAADLIAADLIGLASGGTGGHRADD